MPMAALSRSTAARGRGTRVEPEPERCAARSMPSFATAGRIISIFACRKPLRPPVRLDAWAGGARISAELGAGRRQENAAQLVDVAFRISQ